PADVVLDEHAKRMVAQFSPVRLVVQALTEWAQADPATRRASRRVHLHFYHQPARILGTNQVKGLELERTAPDELGRISGTGERVRFDVGSVYSAIGYRSTPIPGVPFDERRMTVPERDGRVLDTDGSPVPGLYATGWIRRGPVGLIGATKSDASQTIASLLADLAGGRSRATEGAVDALRKRLVDAVDREGWLRIDAAERNLGARRGRDRTKIAERGALLHHASALDAG
ncbi:MAG: pyridine nucleotide-disulfide oxidoreductase, partial [Propionibacterium sp.]|nr:pyridine nucleotide-disulfide oxidoreductase [Propionibacterium sp.]